MLTRYDIVIAGAGPAGLSAAYTAAQSGASVLVIEQNNEIGSPTRTSGGSFIEDLLELGLPKRLFHEVDRLRFVAPKRTAVFDYDKAILCVIDVRGLYQHLAEIATRAGATLCLGAKVLNVVKDGPRVKGVTVQYRTRRAGTIDAEVVIDATGYKGHLLRDAGVSPQFQRFGVGAELDMFAPNCDEHEAVLVVGNEFAPSGYGWVFPWGHNRVRVGVGVIHPDKNADPVALLDHFVESAPKFDANLSGAQPIEYHYGLIPSEMGQTFVGDGILGIGDAAGHASTLVGEGIRWAIKAGRMAGVAAAQAIQREDVSKESLSIFQREWLNKYGRRLKIANLINRKISNWNDEKWDARTELLARLSPEEFATALRTDFSAGWALRVAWAHPQLFRAGLATIMRKVGFAPPEPMPTK